MDTEFSKWLIEQMNKKGWSQSDLSRHSGLTRQAIANYVAGRTPQHDSIVILARVFKVPPETLFRVAQGLPVNADSDPWVEEISHKLRQLSPGLRSVAERLIDGLVEEDEANSPTKPKQKPRPRSSTS